MWVQIVRASLTMQRRAYKSPVQVLRCRDVRTNHPCKSYEVEMCVQIQSARLSPAICRLTQRSHHLHGRSTGGTSTCKTSGRLMQVDGSAATPVTSRKPSASVATSPGESASRCETRRRSPTEVRPYLLEPDELPRMREAPDPLPGLPADLTPALTRRKLELRSSNEFSMRPLPLQRESARATEDWRECLPCVGL